MKVYWLVYILISTLYLLSCLAINKTAAPYSITEVTPAYLITEMTRVIEIHVLWVKDPFRITIFIEIFRDINLLHIEVSAHTTRKVFVLNEWWIVTWTHTDVQKKDSSLHIVSTNAKCLSIFNDGNKVMTKKGTQVGHVVFHYLPFR